MLKKIVAVSLTLVMTMAASVSVFAAGTIDENEKAIITQLEAKGIPAEYVSQAKNYFEQDDVEFTAEEADAVIGNVDEAAAIAKEAGVKSVEDLSKVDTAVVDKIMDKVSAAAAVKDLTVSYDTKGGKAEVKDASGKVVATADVKTKNTGADSMSTIAVVSVLGVAVVALAFAAKKNSKVEA